ncbi:hypothetical protein V1517DRAFT_312784 [Lipomyces orientalis]|uniref:Uncharacterized protein n=1 Tax=Lipomyces orientalis TaxID=1233043 RepID=A0ACC3TXC1_9ASCO
MPLAYLDYTWDDIVPIPQDDGGDSPLAPIAYQDDYKTAMEYLRAVMSVEEFSDRALQLTADLIFMNPAHYTVWAYRARLLLALKKDLEQELIWIEEVGEQFPKNYQIWNHREVIVDKYDNPIRELPFIEVMLELDSKNYHVWSYRQWVVRRFDLWITELDYTDRMIENDVRNNSAWNHRYFAMFGKAEDVARTAIDDEIDYAKTAILKAPQNASAWNYLLGVLKHSNRSLSEIEDFCNDLATLPTTEPSTDIDMDQITSARALEVLADIYASRHEVEKAAQAWTLLAEKYDPIRENYWKFKKDQTIQRFAATA